MSAIDAVFALKTAQIWPMHSGDISHAGRPEDEFIFIFPMVSTKQL